MIVSHAERAAIRTECRLLTRFIKMVDNFLQDSVMALCRDRIREVLRLMIREEQKSINSVQNSSTKPVESLGPASSPKFAKQKKNKTKEQAPLFDVVLSLDEITQDFVLSPSVTDVQDTMQQLIQDVFSIVLHPPILSLQDEDLKVFTQVR